jgi:hypothetical protein
VLVAHGAALLRLRADPVLPPAPDGTAVRRRNTPDGRFRVEQAGAEFTVVDRRTGAVAGTRRIGTDLRRPDWAAIEALWVQSPEDDRWRISRYELPTLAESYAFELPAGDPDRAGWTPAAGTAEVGHVVALSGGLLTAWDRVTGRPAGPPTPVGDTPVRTLFDTTFEVGWSRPGHDGHLAFLTSDLEMQVWDAVAGRRLVTIPTNVSTSGDVTFDGTGKRLAVLTPAQTIEIWDVDSATQLRPPIPAPGANGLVGFTAEGTLAVRTGFPDVLDLIDVDGGFVTGSLGVDANLDVDLLDERQAVTTGADGVLIEVPVIATDWAAHLCAVANRPFTAAELAILPGGADTRPPCS